MRPETTRVTAGHGTTNQDGKPNKSHVLQAVAQKDSSQA